MTNPPPPHEPTRLERPRVEALDAMLGEPIPVLDGGFVRVIDYLGDDAAIVQAARVSYGRGTRTVRSDRGLIRYLMRHWHTSPFEMCEIKLHVKLPIFVARQWIRHRTANVNEISARYSVLDREFYVPPPEELAAQASNNRQGRGTTLPRPVAERQAAAMRALCEDAYALYERLLEGEGDAPGLARELARSVLPVSIYTQWYWKIDLHNLLHFLRLRLDSHAQAEIRAYAQVIADIVSKWVPLTWEAFVDYRLHGASLSRMEVEALRAYLHGERPDLAALGMSRREIREFCERFGLQPDDCPDAGNAR